MSWKYTPAPGGVGLALTLGTGLGRAEDAGAGESGAGPSSMTVEGDAGSEPTGRPPVPRSSATSPTTRSSATPAAPAHHHRRIDPPLSAHTRREVSGAAGYRSTRVALSIPGRVVRVGRR